MLDSLYQNLSHSSWIVPAVFIIVVVFPYLVRIILKRKKTSETKKMIQLLNKTVMSESNELSGGYVCVKGNLSPVDTNLVSPFTQRPCCWYLSSITMIDGATKAQEIIYFNRSIHLCYLEDKKGKIVIYPLNAKAYLDQLKPEKKLIDNVLEYKSFFSEEMLAKLKLKSNNTQYLISEIIIPVDTDVSILGFSDTKYKSESLFCKDKSVLNKTSKDILVSADQAVKMTWYHTKDIALPINEWDKITQEASSEEIDVIIQYNSEIKNPMIITTMEKDELAVRLVKK